MNFPIGTKKAAELLNCPHRTIKHYCLQLYEKNLIEKFLGGHGDYLIYERQFRLLKKMKKK